MPVIAILALALCLSACDTRADQDWRPADDSLAMVSQTTTPVMLDATATAVAHGQRIRNDTVGVQARWAQLSGDHPVNAAITALVQASIAEQVTLAGTPYAPMVFPRGAGLGGRDCIRGSTNLPAQDILADPALGPVNGSGTAVVCDLTFASGSIVGQRVRQVSGDLDAITQDATTTLYADAATGEFSTAAALWAPDAPARLWAQIVDGLRRDGGSLSGLEPAPPGADQVALVAAALDSTLVGEDGSLVVTMPAGITAPELTELEVDATSQAAPWSVPAALARPLLSPFGVRVLDAASAGAPPAPLTSEDDVDCKLVPCVALTYDDGPSDFTSGILDELAARRAHASFFAMGEKATAYSSVLRRTVDEGHTVGNHTWNHPHLPKLQPAEVARQISETTTALQTATGQSVTVFRPPYGEYNPSVLRSAGMAAILWDVDAFDWQHPADDVLISRVVDRPVPGSIVLQHDITEVTARTAPPVYDGLLDRGFTLVSLEQLFGGQLPTSGVWRTGP